LFNFERNLQVEMFIGTKQLRAKPMTRGEYNAFRGWALAENECGDDQGYLVEYLDGGQPNHPDFSAYISWSPADVFEKAYRRSSLACMSFGHAVDLLKTGARVARAGWNGKGMFLFLVHGSRFIVNRAPLLGIYPEGTEVSYRSHIDMKTVDDEVVPWVASQTDILADDWVVVD
jgi:Protein of unknown function (DUF2829)